MFNSAQEQTESLAVLFKLMEGSGPEMTEAIYSLSLIHI